MAEKRPLALYDGRTEELRAADTLPETASRAMRSYTRAQINAAAVASQLISGEVYLITDESRLAVGKGAAEYHVADAATTSRRPCFSLANVGGLTAGTSTAGMAISTLGSGTSRTPATTSLFTSVRRVGYISAATAGASASMRASALLLQRGASAGMGGFVLSMQFGASDAATVADARMFCGMYGTAASIGNVNPSTLTDIVGVGADAAEVNLSLMHNDGTGTATKVDLGANFPANTLSTDLYLLELTCAPAGTDITWRLTRLNTNHIASGVINTNIPAADTLMSVQLWRNNGTTAAAVGLDVCNIYLDTSL